MEHHALYVSRADMALATEAPFVCEHQLTTGSPGIRNYPRTSGSALGRLRVLARELPSARVRHVDAFRARACATASGLTGKSSSVTITGSVSLTSKSQAITRASHLPA